AGQAEAGGELLELPVVAPEPGLLDPDAVPEDVELAGGDRLVHHVVGHAEAVLGGRLGQKLALDQEVERPLGADLHAAAAAQAVHGEAPARQRHLLVADLHRALGRRPAPQALRVGLRAEADDEDGDDDPEKDPDDERPGIPTQLLEHRRGILAFLHARRDAAVRFDQTCGVGWAHLDGYPTHFVAYRVSGVILLSPREQLRLETESRFSFSSTATWWPLSTG